MTNKSDRQRGTRTRGGGSHKHNRGAGHRGGRGAAGRDKHEYHNHPPLGKHGFTPPSQQETNQVRLRELYERAYYANTPQLSGEGVFSLADGTILVDARVVAADNPEKRAEVLYQNDEPVATDGGTAVKNPTRVTGPAGDIRPSDTVQVVADEVTDPVVDAVESNGDELIEPPELQQMTIEFNKDNGNGGTKRKPDDEGGSSSGGTATEGRPLAERDPDPETVTSSDLNPEDVPVLYAKWRTGDDGERELIESLLDDYFADMYERGREGTLYELGEETITPEEVSETLDALQREWEEHLGEDYEPIDGGLKKDKREYLLSVRPAIEQPV